MKFIFRAHSWNLNIPATSWNSKFNATWTRTKKNVLHCFYWNYEMERWRHPEMKLGVNSVLQLPFVSFRIAAILWYCLVLLVTNWIRFFVARRRQKNNQELLSHLSTGIVFNQFYDLFLNFVLYFLFFLLFWGKFS